MYIRRMVTKLSYEVYTRILTCTYVHFTTICLHKTLITLLIRSYLCQQSSPHELGYTVHGQFIPNTHYYGLVDSYPS